MLLLDSKAKKSPQSRVGITDVVVSLCTPVVELAIMLYG